MSAKIRTLALLALVSVLFTCPVNASIVTFDDLTTPLSYNAGSIGMISYGIVPTNYGGFLGLDGKLLTIPI